jgi:hypothetical protein
VGDILESMVSNGRSTLDIQLKGLLNITTAEKNSLKKSFFPMSIKLWDGLAMNLNGLDHTEFKTRLKELLKPPKFRHFNCGFKYPNSLHAQLRLKRSYLNCYLYPIGLSITPACQCGQLETVKHFLIDCKLYEQARVQL